MSHTPGPWRIDGRPGYEALEIISEADHRRIARALYHGGSEDNEADDNARLIAAAPDLLAACKAAHEWLNQYGEHMPIQYGGEQGLDDQLRAAIAKAEAVECPA